MGITRTTGPITKTTPQMPKNDAAPEKRFCGTFPISIIAVIVYIVICIFLSRPFFGWFFFSNATEESMLSATGYERNNAGYHYILGRYYHRNFIKPDPEKALLHYRRSLEINPLQPDAWLDISRVYKSLGQQEKAEFALERAVRLSPNDGELMWNAGSFWLMNNMTDKATGTFRQYLLLEPARQKRVYDLYWKLELDNSYILENVIPDSYEYQSRYLLYLISRNKIPEAEEAWNIIDLEYLDQNVFISYINFLIQQGLYETAGDLWKEITAQIEGLGIGSDSSLIWNPGFDNLLLNGGFDWSIREAKGVDVFIDEVIKLTGTRSLGVTFDGKQNPGITIAQQIVRIKPATHYLLSGYVKTSGITTKNGIILQVNGHKCKGLHKKTLPVTGTNLWREAVLEFKTPRDCNALVVRVRRELSKKLDNKIEGTAWIDSVMLKQQND